MDDDKPGFRGGGALLTWRARKTTTATAVLQTV